MTAYVLTLLAASLAAAVVELIAPKGEGGRLANHVRMIAGLFLLVTLMNPLREGLAILKAAVEGDLPRRMESKLEAATPEDHEAAFEASLAAMGGAPRSSIEMGRGDTGKAERIMDCLECRCCEYICSSKIPLVSKIKAGKAAVRGMK